MEELKKLFSYSKDTVVITDRELNIQWSNRDTSIFHEYGDNCSELFGGIMRPLRSGKYDLAHGGSIIECSVIDYSDRGVYVLITDEEDILMSFIGKDHVRKVLENRAGAMRSAFSGITGSGMELKKMLEDNGIPEGVKCIDRANVNSCKMMRFTAVITELVRYCDDSILIKTVDLAKVLDSFVEESKNAINYLYGNVCGSIPLRFEKEYGRGLFIRTDRQRLESCLLALAMLANGRERENNVIKITAVNSTNSVSLTFTPDSCGTEQGGGPFSRHQDMYDSDEYNIDLLIVKAFCRRFGCTLYIQDEAGEPRSYSIRIPVSTELVLNSDPVIYGSSVLDKYHFCYSDIL